MTTPFRLATRPEKLRLRVEDFLLLNDSGAFERFSKTELIEGEIWYRNTQFAGHARVKTDLAVELGLALRAMKSKLSVIVEAATRIDDYSLPEPDIVLTDYTGDHVVPLESVALIVEVADTTLKIDTGRKLRIYAEAGVPEYWVVDLKAGLVRQMWVPEGGNFAQRRETALSERIEAVTVKGLAVALRGA